MQCQNKVPYICLFLSKSLFFQKGWQALSILIDFYRGGNQPASWLCSFTWVPGSRKGRCGSAKQGQPRATKDLVTKADISQLRQTLHIPGQGQLNWYMAVVRVTSTVTRQVQAPWLADSAWAVKRPGMATAGTSDLSNWSKDRSCPLKKISKQRTWSAMA